MNETILKNQIMRNVKTIYILRKIVHPVTLKCGILIAAAFVFGSLVHVSAVFGNMPPVFDFASLYNFSMYAFTNTGVMVQAVMIASVLVVFWIGKDIAHKIQFDTFTLSHA